MTLLNSTASLVTSVSQFIFGKESSKFNLTQSEKLILMALATCAGSKGIFPKQQTIARKVGVCILQIKRGLKRLRELGLISIKKIWKMNSYVFSFLPIEEQIPPDKLSTGYNSQVSSTIPDQVSSTIPDTIYNNIKYIERESAPRKDHATPLTDDFMFDQKTVDLLNDVNLEDQETKFEFDKFMDYYQGNKIKKTNWNVTFRSWIMRAATFKNKFSTRMNTNKVNFNEKKCTTPFYDGKLIDNGWDRKPITDEVVNQAMDYIYSKLGCRRKTYGMGSKA